MTTVFLPGNKKINKKSSSGILILATLLMLIPGRVFSQLNADFTANSTSVCSGNTVTFTDASTGTTPSTVYSWSFGPEASPATATGPGPHMITYSGSVPQTVSLTLIDGVTSTVTRINYIIVHPLPDVIIDAAGPFCNDAAAVQLVGTPGGGEFSGTGVSITGLFTPGTAGEGSHLITYSFTDVNSCSNNVNTNIIVNTTPPAPVVTVTDNCDGTSTLSTAATGTLLWSTGAATPSITVNTGGSYTVTTTVIGCTSLPGSGTAAPKTTPAVPVVTITDNCNGTSTLSTAASGTLLWSTGAATPSITVNTAGSYTVTTTVNGCTSLPGSGTAAPKTTPAVPVVTITDNCNGTSTLFTAASGTLLWSTGAATPSITVNTAGSYTVTTTVNGCTSLPGSGTAAPKTTPTAPVVTIINNCNGTSTLSTAATGTLLWSTGAATPSITVNTAVSYTVTTTVNGCTSLPGSGTAAPKTTPTAPVVTVTDNCNGTSTLSTAASGTLLWSTGAASPSITVNTAGSYTVTTTVNGCTSLPGSGTAAPKTTPTEPVVTIVNNCNGTSTLSTAATGTLLWSTGVATPSITVSTAGSYTVTTTVNGCTSLPGSGTAAPKTTPPAPVPGIINQPTCTVSTGSVILNGLPSPGTWTLTRNPGSIISTGTGTSTTVSLILTGRYTFTVSNAAGCTSVASSEINITSQPVTPTVPVVGVITQPTCLAATGSVTLSGLPETGLWTLTRYPGTTSTISTGTTTTISGLATGTYNFAIRNSDGCTSVISSNAVISTQPVTPAAPLVGTITHPTLAIPTGSVVLNGLPSGIWILTQNPGGVRTNGTGATRTVSGLEPGTFTFLVTNPVGCTSVSSGNVVINARPGAPSVVITDPARVCSPATVDMTRPSITEGSDAGLIFTYWTDPSATITYNTPSAATAGTYYIKGTTTAGYFTIKPVIVTIDQRPSANGGPDQVLEYLFETTLSAEPVSVGTGAWSLVSGTGELSDAGKTFTSVSGLSIGENLFLWTVTNGVCPAAIDYLSVTVNDLRIPTLFTPDGDPYNEYFLIRGIETLGKTEMIIYDGRGVQVYKTSNYENDWNGLDSSGDPLPEDTYFYILKAANGKSLSGYIVIKR